METAIQIVMDYGKTSILLTLLLLCTVSVPSRLWAQSAANSGQIAGQVLDPSGAAVPGVEVSARNIDTNYTRMATTDDAGRYAVGPVPLGPASINTNFGLLRNPQT